MLWRVKFNNVSEISDRREFMDKLDKHRYILDKYNLRRDPDGRGTLGWVIELNDVNDVMDLVNELGAVLFDDFGDITIDD